MEKEIEDLQDTDNVDDLIMLSYRRKTISILLLVFFLLIKVEIG